MKSINNDLDFFLKDIYDVCEVLDLKPWLEAGTLLGCIRNKKFIKWDNDIDLGIFKSSLKKNLRNLNFK